MAGGVDLSDGSGRSGRVSPRADEPGRDAHFEDIDVGLTRDCGSLTVTEAEIVAFGERYDPQPFHADPEAVEDSAFGGLVASG